MHEATKKCTHNFGQKTPVLKYVGTYAQKGKNIEMDITEIG